MPLLMFESDAFKVPDGKKWMQGGASSDRSTKKTQKTLPFHSIETLGTSQWKICCFCWEKNFGHLEFLETVVQKVVPRVSDDCRVTVPQKGGLPGCMVPRANGDIKLSILWLVRTVTLNRLVRLMIFTVIVLNHAGYLWHVSVFFSGDNPRPHRMFDRISCISFSGFSRLAKSWSFALASRIAYADWFCAWYTTAIFPGVRLSTASLSKPKKDVENVSTKSGTELELSHLRKDENLFRSGQVFSQTGIVIIVHPKWWLEFYQEILSCSYKGMYRLANQSWMCLT